MRADRTTPCYFGTFQQPFYTDKVIQCVARRGPGARRAIIFSVLLWQFTEMGERKICFCDGVRTDFTQPDCKAGLTMSIVRRRLEVAGRRAERRF